MKLKPKGKISNLLVDQITADERTKLAGIETGATANETDAHLKVGLIIPEHRQLQQFQILILKWQTILQ